MVSDFACELARHSAAAAATHVAILLHMVRTKVQMHSGAHSSVCHTSHVVCYVPGCQQGPLKHPFAPHRSVCMTTPGRSSAAPRWQCTGALAAPRIPSVQPARIAPKGSLLLELGDRRRLGDARAQLEQAGSGELGETSELDTPHEQAARDRAAR